MDYQDESGEWIGFDADLAKAFAESLGGVESLLTYPIAQTHAEMPKELLARTSLDDRLLRLSIGIEAVDDIIADLDQALNG